MQDHVELAEVIAQVFNYCFVPYAHVAKFIVAVMY